jgi:hypothetical protein
VIKIPRETLNSKIRERATGLLTEDSASGFAAGGVRRMTKSPAGAIVNSRPAPAPTVGTVQFGIMLAIVCIMYCKGVCSC